MNFEMGDEQFDEQDAEFFSVEGLESVAETMEEKYTVDDWYGDYSNIIEVASYLVYERYELSDSKDLLYLFEKPHKYYREFIECQVWHEITHGANHYFSEEEIEHIGDTFDDFVNKREKDNK